MAHTFTTFLLWALYYINHENIIARKPEAPKKLTMFSDGFLEFTDVNPANFNSNNTIKGNEKNENWGPPNWKQTYCDWFMNKILKNNDNVSNDETWNNWGPVNPDPTDWLTSSYADTNIEKIV